MKKTVTFVIVLTLGLSALFMMTGCSGQKASVKDVEFLTGTECWYFYDEVTGENEKMSFQDDFTFYWGCECGEPVGNSDCYEVFDYDKETGVIHLYNEYDDMSLDLQVLDYSDYHLLLEVEGRIKDYTYVDYDYDVADAEKYMKDYSMVAHILEGNEDDVLLTHYDYDGDIEYPDNVKKSYPIAKDAEFQDLQVRTRYKDNEMVENKSTYRQLTRKEAAATMEYGSSGFIWINENLEIEKITFYGEIRIEE